jgi:hypothetical protein
MRGRLGYNADAIERGDARCSVGESGIWNIELDDWPELACLAAGRNLTHQEWEEFGPRGQYHATCDHWPAD